MWRATAEPFGKTSPSVNQITFNLRFPGQYDDSETGLVYNHLRTYDPRTGRYVQADPLGQSAGLNLYTYALGDPIHLVDPYGADWNDFARGLGQGLVIGGAFGVAAQVVGTNPYGRIVLAGVGLLGLAYSSPEVYRLLTDPCATDAERDAFLGQVVGGVLAGGLVFRGGGALGAGQVRGSSPPGLAPKGAGGFIDDAARLGSGGGGRSTNFFLRDPDAGGTPLTVFRRNPLTGRIENYETFDPQGLAGGNRRFRGTGKPHGGVEPPLVLEPRPGHPGGRPYRARTALPDELPLGF